MGDVDGAKPGARSILPLPDNVIAQIKSATAITSLTGVVVELIKNALDAKATSVDVSVDFARGGCSVEDNGLGIAPVEFREGGGLGNLYCWLIHLQPAAVADGTQALPSTATSSASAAMGPLLPHLQPCRS